MVFSPFKMWAGQGYVGLTDRWTDGQTDSTKPIVPKPNFDQKGTNNFILSFELQLHITESYLQVQRDALICVELIKCPTTYLTTSAFWILKLYQYLLNGKAQHLDYLANKISVELMDAPLFKVQLGHSNGDKMHISSCQ